MKIKQCTNGHHYDAECYAICPHCCRESVSGVNVPKGKNDGDEDGDAQTVLLDSEATVLLDAEPEAPGAAEEAKAEPEQPKAVEEAKAGPVPPDQVRCLNCMEEYDSQFQVCPHCGYVRGTAPKEVYHLHPGMTLADRYEIGTVLGFGGFGITYKAWDRKLKSTVAIKEYYPAGIVNRIPGEKEVILYSGKGRQEFGNGLTRFLEEARNTARFSTHPNIVNVFDFFEENGTAYIVMEYLEGISFKQYIKQAGGKLDYNTVTDICGFIMDALEVIHSSGILHRDISPDNIFICSDGRVKLIDFGAARFSTGDEEKTLSIVLKMGFAPPEQYRSKSRQGPWTDVYALGATMYRAITGIVPDESVNRVVEDHLKKPGELTEGIPEYLDAALMKAMALDPELRFQTVAEFKEAVKNQRKTLALEAEVKLRKKKRLVGIGVVLCVLALIFGFSFQTYRDKKNTAVLQAATVTVWLPADSAESVETDRTVFDSMAEEFAADYPSINLEVTCLPKEEYVGKLREALNHPETLPVLFDSSALTAEELQSMADVSGCLELLDSDACYFLDQYDSYFPDHRQLPLGFEIPVCYVNISLYEDPESWQEKNSLADFLAGRSAVCVAGSGEFYSVQDNLSGIYGIVPQQDSPINARFKRLFSINGQADQAQRTAALRLLYYFLGENAQDALHIGGRGGLPLNKNLAEVYFEVNPEMDFLKDRLEGLTMIPESQVEESDRDSYRSMEANREASVSYIQKTINGE